jgi:hypothetical protein
MYSVFHLEVRTEPLNYVYMNLEHKSLRTWKNDCLLMVACQSGQC